MRAEKLESTGKQGFNQLASGLRSAIDEFDRSGASETLAAIVASLRPVAKMTGKAWRKTISYSQRHPIRVAITVVALGFLATRLAPVRRSWD